MLKTVWLTKKNRKGKNALLLGGFDGLHVGHRQLLSYAKAQGLSVGVTCIWGGKEGCDLFTFAEREDIFRQASADFTVELTFTDIKNIPPMDFLRILEKEYEPSLFVCGEDFRFGAKAAGTPKMIKEHTQVRVETFSLLEIDGEKVSARRIKTLVGDGEVEKAAVLLAHPFFLIGEVYQDRGVGKTIGFPTANIRYPRGKTPLKMGVYETRVCVDGKTYPGITNYGARPTFADDTVVTETYLDGFSGDLYGKEIKVEFIRFLREIQKFDCVDALKKQLEYDIGRVRKND